MKTCLNIFIVACCFSVMCKGNSPKEDYLHLFDNKVARNELILDTLFFADSFHILEIYSKVGWPVLAQDYLVNNFNFKFERLADTTITSASRIAFLIRKLMNRMPQLNDSTFMYLIANIIWVDVRKNGSDVSIRNLNESTYLLTAMNDSIICHKSANGWNVDCVKIKLKLLD